MISHLMGVWSFTWPVHGSYMIIAWSAKWVVHDSHGTSQARILEWVAISLLQGIFPIQGSNQHLLSLLRWQANYLPPSHLGNPGTHKSRPLKFSRGHTLESFWYLKISLTYDFSHKYLYFIWVYLLTPLVSALILFPPKSLKAIVFWLFPQTTLYFLNTS